MANKDKILDYIKSVSPKRLSNSDINKATGIKPHQQVFQITNLLLNKGQIKGIRIGHAWKFWYENETNSGLSNSSTIYEQIIDAFKDEIGNTFLASEIKDRVNKNFDINKSSISPPDYCYNRINKGIPFDKHIFIRIGDGQYKYVGEN